MSDLDGHIERLVRTLHIANAKRGRINEEGEDSDEDDFTEYIENDFNSVKQTGRTLGSNLAKILNKEKTCKKLESMPSKPYNTSFKTSKTCVDSLQSLGIALRMGIKGITLVNTRNLTTTVTATAASTKNKREIKYGKSTKIY